MEENNRTRITYKRVFGSLLFVFSIVLLIVFFLILIMTFTDFLLAYALGFGGQLPFNLSMYIGFFSGILLFGVYFTIIMWLILRSWRLLRGDSWCIVKNGKNKYIFPILKPVLIVAAYIFLVVAYAVFRVQTK